MSADTRSHAEIIGWQVEVWSGERHRDGCLGTEDQCGCQSRPTADDLLSWLVSKGLGVAISFSDAGAELELCLHVPDGVEPEHDAPTLLAALEAAVRAVAGES